MYTYKATDLIKEFEGLRLKSYRCPAGKLTIGYGHTGSDVKENMTITKKQADMLLKKDLQILAEMVDSLLKYDVNQNQFDAILSFVYNVGIGNFMKSKMLKYINQGKIKEAADEFLKWNKSNGVVLKGLVRRREAERALFLS